MRNFIRQFSQHVNAQIWPVFTGSIVVLSHEKNTVEQLIKIAAGHAFTHVFAYSRDGPIIFHMRDGPPDVTGPPRFMSESGPPKTTGPPMEWLVRKKSLKKH